MHIRALSSFPFFLILDHKIIHSSGSHGRDRYEDRQSRRRDDNGRHQDDNRRSYNNEIKHERRDDHDNHDRYGKDRYDDRDQKRGYQDRRGGNDSRSQSHQGHDDRGYKTEHDDRR